MDAAEELTLESVCMVSRYGDPTWNTRLDGVPDMLLNGISKVLYDNVLACCLTVYRTRYLIVK